jgi:hypothetical protein
VTRQVDELARHARRLGNHELNELLLQLPKPYFAALAEVALARPVLPAGLVLRFEPAPGVDGWTVVACAPRRPLGTLTRHLDRAAGWSTAPGPRPATQSSPPGSRAGGDAGTRPPRWPGPCRSVGLAVWPWPPTSAPFPILRCTSCWSGCPGIGSTSCWMLLSRLRGRPHDRRQALPALRPGQGGRGVLPAPGPAAVVLLPALHPGGLAGGATPPAAEPGHRGPAAGGGSGPPTPPLGPGPPGR